VPKLLTRSQLVLSLLVLFKCTGFIAGGCTSRLPKEIMDLSVLCLASVWETKLCEGLLVFVACLEVDAFPHWVLFVMRFADLYCTVYVSDRIFC